MQTIVARKLDVESLSDTEYFNLIKDMDRADAGFSRHTYIISDADYYVICLKWGSKLLANARLK